MPRTLYYYGYCYYGACSHALHITLRHAHTHADVQADVYASRSRLRLISLCIDRVPLTTWPPGLPTLRKGSVPVCFSPRRLVPAGEAVYADLP